MRIAVLSDIHANGDALDAVERDLEKKKPDGICHLGDLVGYNAEPERCVRWAMERASAGILGNHDAVASGRAGGEFFNAPALVAAHWAGTQLSGESLAYLRSLPPRTVFEDGSLLVHGSPSDPERYLFMLDDAADELDALARSGGAGIVFFGHTHVPAAVVRRRDGSASSLPPEEVRLGEGEIALLNPGSVGQPRDRNPMASYLLFDTESRTASWIRVAYDIVACQRKILAAGLPRLFAARLAEGA